MNSNVVGILKLKEHMNTYKCSSELRFLCSCYYQEKLECPSFLPRAPSLMKSLSAWVPSEYENSLVRISKLKESVVKLCWFSFMFIFKKTTFHNSVGIDIHS